MIRKILDGVLGIGRRIAGRNDGLEMVDPLNRRFPGARLKGYPAFFFRERDHLLAEELLPKVYAEAQSEEGYVYEKLLQNPEYSKYDERIVEYSWLLWKLVRLDTEIRQNLIDVGCVLNHKAMADYLSTMYEMIWFMNPAPELLKYNNYAAYILSDIRKHRLPQWLQFDTVTCFSTLEHIGMDTKRYGGPGGELNLYPDQPQRNAIEALQSMYRLLRPGGRLYLSVPYGPFEYLYDYGGTLPIYYTFDNARLEDLLSCLPHHKDAVSVEIYKVVPGWGWQKTDMDDDKIPAHAVGCSAAGGVALVEVIRSLKINGSDD
jgi:SAM-dependent methyltransferase